MSLTVFKLFDCEPMEDGSSYLRADYSIQCYQANGDAEPEYASYRTWAALAIAIYPCGVPMVLLALLLSRRAELAVDEGADFATVRYERPLHPRLAALSFLFEPWRVDLWYMEPIDMWRRISLIGLPMLFPTSSAR